MEGVFFLKVLTKGGIFRTISIGGFTRDLVMAYVSRHLTCPATRLFRQLPHPSFPLGSERLAKRSLLVMASLGVDTTTFKAHSLRGLQPRIF